MSFGSDFPALSIGFGLVTGGADLESDGRADFRRMAAVGPGHGSGRLCRQLSVQLDRPRPERLLSLDRMDSLRQQRAGGRLFSDDLSDSRDTRRSWEFWRPWACSASGFTPVQICTVLRLTCFTTSIMAPRLWCPWYSRTWCRCAGSDCGARVPIWSRLRRDFRSPPSPGSCRNPMSRTPGSVAGLGIPAPIPCRAPRGIMSRAPPP